MGYNYFKSTEVKIFPCYRRGVYDVNGSLGNETTDTVIKTARYDPTARLITEYNLTHLYGMVGKYDSYIVSTTMEPNLDNRIIKICAVIKGYYFEITNKTGFDQNILGGYLTCCIKSDKPDSQGEVTLHAIKIDKSSGTDILTPGQNTSLDYIEDDSPEGICLAVVWGDRADDPEKGFYSVPFTRKLQDLIVDKSDLTGHTGAKDNPHEVTKAQIGLGNVDNKSVATIKSELGANGTVEANKAGFVTGGAVYTAVEAAKADAIDHADDLNTVMNTRVVNLESFTTAQETKNGELAKDIANEATARKNNDDAINEMIEELQAALGINTQGGSADTSITSRVTQAETDIDNLQKEFNDETGRVKVAEGTIAALDTAKLDAQTFNSWKETHKTDHANEQTAITSAINTAKQDAYDDAVAEAARLDGLLKAELRGEIDSDVADAIASEVARANGAYDTAGSAATAKSYADSKDTALHTTIKSEIADAKDEAKLYAEILLQTVTVTLEFTTTIEEKTVRKEISALKQLPFYMPSYNAVFDENAQYAGKWYLEDLSYEYKVGSMVNLFDLQVAEGKDKITFTWTEDTSD